MCNLYSINRGVIASEAKQSMASLADGWMDCFVACAPRNDSETQLTRDQSAIPCQSRDGALAAFSYSAACCVGPSSTSTTFGGDIGRA